MAGRYKPYPEYKDSHSEWMGLVPCDWTLMQAKFCFVLQRGHDLSSDQMVEGEYPVYGSNGPIGIHNDFTTKAPSITVGRSGSVGEINYVEVDYWAHNTSLYVKDFIDSPPRFIYYLLLAINPKRLSAGSAVGTLDRNNVHSQTVAVPSHIEKNNIAKFLDHETAKIDTLIEKQQQLIQLLKEKRQAVISHAVTKGLNQNAKKRDSGVEWLGEIPIHWDVKRIGLLFTESSARAFSDVELEYPILSVSIHHGISDKELNEGELDRKITRSEDRSLYKIVHDNYLAYNMMRAWQGSFGSSKLSGLVSPAYVVCQPKTLLNSYYFELILRTQNATVELKKYSRGITDFRLRLYWDEFKSIFVPVPSSAEIDEILNYITKTNSTYENLIVIAGRQIELLLERRTALISAAVTGKIDVRNWVAPVERQTNGEVAA